MGCDDLSPSTRATDVPCQGSLLSSVAVLCVFKVFVIITIEAMGGWLLTLYLPAVTIVKFNTVIGHYSYIVIVRR